MSPNFRTRRVWGLVPLAVVLVLVVAAVPATAKGPLLVPQGCPPAAAKAPPPQYVQARCAQATAANRQAEGSSDSTALAAGGVAAAILIVAGAMLIARHRDIDDPRPAALT
jgi:hypothetical protein